MREYEPDLKAVNTEKRNTRDRLVAVSGWIDGGAILYGLAVGAVAAMVLGLSGLILKSEYLRGRKK